MYCGNCGTKVEQDWLFCKQCGHQLEQPVADEPATMVADTNSPSDIPVTPAAPRKPLSPVAKRNLMIGGGVLVLVIAVVLILRLTNGPGTPQQLAEKVNAAIEAGDASQLAAYLDDPDSPLHDDQKVALLTEALQNPDTKEQYESAIASAVEAADDTISSDPSSIQEVRDRLSHIWNSNSEWLSFSPEQSWRGTRWSLHVEPVQVGADTSYMPEDVQSTIRIGDLKADEGVLEGLWPAVYNYQATIDGTYASVPVEGTVDAFEVNQVNTATVDQSKIQSLFVTMPDTDAEVMLNDKAVSSDQGRSVTIFPAPAEAKFTVSLQTQGADLKGEATIKPAEEEGYNLNSVLQKPIAEKALDVVYTASESLATAINTSDPKALKGVNPDSDYYNRATWEMNSFYSKPKYKLEKVIVDQDSVEIRKDGIHLTATQVYKKTNEDGSVVDDNVSWDYVITQQPNTENWWVDSGYSGWSSAINSSNKLEKSASESKESKTDSTTESTT